MRFTFMRFTWAAISLICSVGGGAAQQVSQVSDIDLPYSACGDMAALRANLTGAPSPRRRATPSFADWAFVASARRPRRGFANANERRPPEGGRRRQSAQDRRGHRPG